ncbi:MAG TPA: inositol monophosphatase family protein [Casimicrobiaceae bacterium]|nr:inositol monophosphatase family protein [Casimicrobiaceae bacterium]
MSIIARYVAAQQIAVKAGRLARDFFAQRATLAVEAKGRQDFVSHADRTVEQLIRGEIEREFPGDGFLGEETAASFSGSDERVWVVDPIDGTHNFLRGVRYYCVSIAYVERGRCEVGAVFDPEHDELFHARRGHGAWLEQAGSEQRLHVSDCASLASAFVCLGHHDRRPEPRYIAIRQALMDRGAAMRNMGAGALQLAHVAADRYDAFVELSLNAWDALAGLLMVEEAGGYAAPFPGPEGLRRPAPALGCAKGLAAELVPLVFEKPLDCA